MNIVIYEKDIHYRRLINEIFDYAIRQYKVKSMIALSSGKCQKIIEFIHSNLEFTLYVLDDNYSRNECEALSIAREIRKNDWFSSIVFVSNDLTQYQKVFKFKVEAMDFIDRQAKDFTNRLIGCLLLAQKKQLNGIKSNVFSFQNKTTIVSIKYDDIVLFESIPNTHRIKLYSKIDHKNYSYYILHESLCSVEKKLGEKFLRCHNSYIVNKEHIKNVNKREKKVEMSNGKICYYSRGKARLLFEGISH